MLREPEPTRTQLWERQWGVPHLDAARCLEDLPTHTTKARELGNSVLQFLARILMTAQEPCPSPRHRLQRPQQELAFQDLS